jgi:hypothetical protein
LCISGEVFRLVDDHYFELLLGRLVHLLSLRDLLQKVLHNNPVVVSNVGRGDFEMIVGRDDVELELPIASGLENPSVDSDLLHAWAVELLQGRYYPRLLSRSGRAVDEEMGEIAALGLPIVSYLSMEPGLEKPLPATGVSRRAHDDR